MGVHGPRLQPEEHAEGAGRARGYRQDPRGDPRLHRQAAARLARPRPHRDLGDARSPGGGGLRLRGRLGARRPAGAAQDPHQAHRQRALHAGMQRRRHDADPASSGGRVSQPRHRPVRADPPRRGQIGARDGAGGASLHHGRAPPSALFPRGTAAHPQQVGRAVLDRRADPRLVRRRQSLRRS